jgi:hypothetical protein
MKILVILILFAASAFAQDQGAITAAESACGPTDANFHIKTDTRSRPVLQPEAGKALVFVIEDQKFQGIKAVTIRIGLDGAWLGATRGNSYMSFMVEPGEHHLCADWVSQFLEGGRLVSLAALTAESGRVYYFRVRNTDGPASFVGGSGLEGEHEASLDLELVNSDEGKLLVVSSSLSKSQAQNQRSAK